MASMGFIGLSPAGVLPNVDEALDARGIRRNSARLRILMVTSLFPRPENPTLGTWALNQARALGRVGCDIHVAALAAWGSRPLNPFAAHSAFTTEHDWDGVPATYVNCLSLSVSKLAAYCHRDPRLYCRVVFESARLRLARLMRTFKPDVLFAHVPMPGGYVANRLGQMFDVPVIVTQHSIGDALHHAANNPRRGEVFRRVAEEADRFVAVSGRLAEITRQKHPGLDPIVLHNGVEEPPAEVTQTPRPAELVGKTVVFSAGFFYPCKQFPLLVRAFGKVAHEFPEAVLRIGGDGEDRAHVEQAIAQSGLGADRVQLLGLLEPRRVLQEMAWCDLFALPSVEETFATVCLEAASCGRAMIWSRDGGINDVLSDGREGAAVEPGDEASLVAALRRLLGDAASRERMGASAAQVHRSRVSSLTQARKVVKLCRDVIAERGQGRRARERSSMWGDGSLPARRGLSAATV